MFLPSGTMCNQISILMHCRPGDEILAHESSHIIANEGGGPGALAGAVILGLRGARGMFDCRHHAGGPAGEAAERAAADPGGGGADRERRRRLGLAGGTADRRPVHRP